MELIKEETAFTVKGFSWDHSFKYEKYSRETDEETGSRLYQVGEYNVPSVTTIL